MTKSTVIKPTEQDLPEFMKLDIKSDLPRNNPVRTNISKSLAKKINTAFVQAVVKRDMGVIRALCFSLTFAFFSKEDWEILTDAKNLTMIMLMVRKKR